MRRKLLIVGLLLWGHWGWAQTTTEGTEFWLGFMQNFDSRSPSSLEIFLTSRSSANVEIFSYRTGGSQVVSVNPGQTRRVFINTAEDNPAAALGSGNIERKGYRIISDEPISVYAFNSRDLSADATIVLPINSLGKKYYASTYYERHIFGDEYQQGQSQSELLIVGVEDSTTVNIIPKVSTIDGKLRGELFTITLNRGDIYQLQAEGDLTGTLIESVYNNGDCKNFAVFGGNKWARVTGGDNCVLDLRPEGAYYPGGFAADHLYEQMYPVNTWGKEYVALPFELRTGYVLQITATEDNTRIFINGVLRETLNAGEYATFQYEDEVTSIRADQPIQVAQMSQSFSCDITVQNGIGDPFMIMLSPNEQKLKEITFNALETEAIEEYFVTVITDTDATSEFRVNNATPSGTFTQVSGSPELSYLRMPLEGGADNTFLSASGFIAYVYGFGEIESFGYVAGASLENLNLQVIAEDPTIGILAEEGCANSLIDFKADLGLEPGELTLFNTFEWDFGDGNQDEGIQVFHSYEQAGTYEVRLLASDGRNDCSKAEIVTRKLTITEVEVSPIVGPSSICPNVTEVIYSVEGAPGNTYEWMVSGGTIKGSSTGSRITVDWGTANSNAYVKVLPYNYLGCQVDALSLDVVISERLEPEAIQGPKEVCLADNNNFSYGIPGTNGSTYQWFIEGGRFLSGSDSNEIEVAWNGTGVGRLWYSETNSVTSNCEGISPMLEVSIFDEIIATPEISDVSCNGANDGAISLSFSNSEGPFSVSWDNGMTGAEISGLPAGTYRAAVTEEGGCELEASFTVYEPMALTFSRTELMDVRCFQESNGMITAEVTGGTTDGQNNYTYTWTGNGINESGTNAFIEGLLPGDYALTVTDANDCQISMDFTINEPPLLEPDLESLINETICPSATNGTAFIDAKGGVPDYQFYWSNKPNTDQQEATDLSRGNYTVRIVDANGCETSLDIEVNERFPRVFLPNAFSPNGDENNDTFQPVTDCDLQYSLQIFNQWGSIVFATENIFEGWDGTINGKDAPVGKYSYMIFYSGTINGVAFEESVRNTLRLVR